MPIFAKVESPTYYESDSEEYINKDHIFYHHSAHAGKLVVARCLGDTEGGLVYMSDDEMWSAHEPTPRDIARVISDKYLHKFLFPWHSIKIPTHLDGGEAATLTLHHEPTYIVLNKIRFAA